MVKVFTLPAKIGILWQKQWLKATLFISAGRLIGYTCSTFLK
jgi:hypothetical protein